jgi:hypothetical protein
MTAIGICMNLLLACLLAAALAMGWRLNRRLKALRDSHDGFAVAVRELNGAAARAEQGLADLRAATDEALDTLSDRIEKGRALAARLERLLGQAPAETPEAQDPRGVERRLGALLAQARETRPERLTAARPAAAVRPAPAARPAPSFEDDLFDDAPLTLHAVRGGRR